MKYYTIGISDDPKVIGYYPQLEFRKGYNPSNDDGYYSLPNNGFPNFVPNIELELHQQAIVTNILPCYPGGFGLILDEKVREILKEHCIPPHAFYPIKVYHRESVLNYYWFDCIPNDFWKLIITQESYAQVHKIKKGVVNLSHKVPIVSKNQIIEEMKKYGGLNPISLGKLVMKKEFFKYDFYLTETFYQRIISKKLKDALDEANIKGHTTTFFDKLFIS